MSDITCYAFVRAPHGAWRDAETEVVSLNASMLVDADTYSDGQGTFTRKPVCKGLRIDGAECVRFRLKDGRMCAITLVAARST